MPVVFNIALPQHTAGHKNKFGICCSRPRWIRRGFAGMQTDDQDIETRPAFGVWLLKQRDRIDRVDGIADAARASRALPRNGNT